MLRGIKFFIPNEYSSYLSKILEGVDLNSYTWRLIEDDVLVSSDNYLFPSDTLTGQELNNCMAQPSYLVLFLYLQAFPLSSTFDEILTYDDFNRSACELVIFVVDAVFVEVYCKNRNLVETIKQNALLNQFEGIEYITSRNDKRVMFRAL